MITTVEARERLRHAHAALSEAELALGRARELAERASEFVERRREMRDMFVEFDRDVSLDRASSVKKKLRSGSPLEFEVTDLHDPPGASAILSSSNRAVRRLRTDGPLLRRSCSGRRRRCWILTRSSLVAVLLAAVPSLWRWVRPPLPPLHAMGSGGRSRRGGTAAEHARWRAIASLFHSVSLRRPRVVAVGRLAGQLREA